MIYPVQVIVEAIKLYGDFPLLRENQIFVTHTREEQTLNHQ